MREESLISVVATCHDVSTVHQTLSAPQGLHIFQQVIEIKPPDKSQRASILHKLIQRHALVDTSTCDSLDVSPLVAKTEGFVARDLELVLHRAVHSHWILNPGTHTHSVILIC